MENALAVQWVETDSRPSIARLASDAGESSEPERHIPQHSPRERAVIELLLLAAQGHVACLN
jgi:hypothetical protein